MCPATGKIFELVAKLAQKYQQKILQGGPPVPNDLITETSLGVPIEVRYVPLRAHRGAVWRLSDSWIIHLNSKDTPARQRFTLYHEIFHILAHCQATPVFKKTPDKKDGIFNEMLADHFSALMLMPEAWLREKWREIGDISQLAAIFEVPKPLIYCSLTFQGLI